MCVLGMAAVPQLKNVEKLDEFIMTEKELNFDLETAITVCSPHCLCLCLSLSLCLCLCLCVVVCFVCSVVERLRR